MRVLIAILILFIPLTSFALKLNLDYPSFGDVDLNRVESEPSEAGKILVEYIYNALISLSGLAAFVMIIRAGVLWATARDNVGQVKEAQDILKDVFLGLLLVLSSVVIVRFINPDILNLQWPSL